jgi:hypothetical protein
MPSFSKVITLARKKKQSNENTPGEDQKPKYKEKPSYPKQMTIRYDELQEKEILQMQARMGEKTMSKAFLKAPEMLSSAFRKVKEHEDQISSQAQELQELRQIVDGWTAFNKKLEDWVSKK